VPPFLRRTFDYRRRYVDAIIERAPNRATLAVVAEIARLSFAGTGSALVALVLWLLTAGAWARDGVSLRSFAFAACAVAATFCALFACLGIAHGARDFSRVRRAVR
jgi:hypothetical protein